MSFLPGVKSIRTLVYLVLFLMSAVWPANTLVAQGPPGVPAATPPQSQTQEAPAQPPEFYDDAIFQKPIPPDQLAFVTQFAGVPSNDLFRDKQFRKLMKSFVPDCMFHYGSDMPLDDALDRVFSGSRDPVVIRDGRYLLLSGARGPYLMGRGFLWIDLKKGMYRSNT